MVRSVERNLALAGAVVHEHLKTSGGRNQELGALFMRMRSSGFPSWNVVEVENSLYIKREMLLIFNWRNIARPKINNGQCDDGCVENCIQSFLIYFFKHLKITNIIVA